MSAPPASVGSVLSLEDLQANFDLPMREAAAKFKMCVTLLKHQCRMHSIKRWPYRQVMASLRGNERLKQEHELAAAVVAALVLVLILCLICQLTRLVKHASWHYV